MGLASDLGYELREQTGLRRTVISMASTRSASRVNRRILRPLDSLVLRLTRGRSSFTSWSSGIPPLWVTTTGARSGQPRTVPLLGVPLGAGIALLGTSFGQEGTPAWVHNLEVNPDASVTYRSKTIPVRARPAAPDEETNAWEQAIRVYPGYGNYSQWASNRRIRVFVLETAAADPD